MTPLALLVGRPNAGKSSLYNALTLGRARVGNFPGVTVDVLEGTARLPKAGADVRVADLPGLYSVVASVREDTDEAVARRALDDARASGGRYVVVQVVDATQLALGLRLTRELARRREPLVLVLTQCDRLEGEGLHVRGQRLAEKLGVPVVEVSARTPDEARARLLDALDAALTADVAPPRTEDFDPRAITEEVVERVAGEHARAARRHTARLDAVLLHPLVGPVAFLGLMTALFAAVFLVADPASTAMDAGVTLARGALERALGDGALTSFLADGVLGGVGTVVAFLPQIVVLTAAMELLEASGYFARGAFLVDRLLGVLGLSGRAFVPLLMGHACAVPAISATRILRDPRERLTTILVLPLTTCSARLPTYGLVIQTFFGDESALVRALLVVALYAAGVLSALVASLVLRRTVTRGKGLPLVLELPAYRAPSPRLVLDKTWRAAARFLRDVGTTIAAASAVLWILLHVPSPVGTPPADATPIERSVAATVGRALEPVTGAAGFDWRINVGLVGSFGARELMVGTLGVIYGVESEADDPGPLSERLREAKRPDGSPVYGPATGLALLAFFVLACQCMSTLAAIRRETRSLRWPAFVLAYTYAAGYAAAVVAFQLARAAGLS